jgi:thioredoxin-like negative regulator of GroEL
MLDEIENKPNIEVIDVDERSDVAIEYGIRSVPTMIKMDENNNVLDRFVGTKTQTELEKWLNG